MPRVSINIDLENNQLLEEEVIKAIEAAAKSKARSIFSATVDEELKRLANDCLERWNKADYWDKKTKLDKRLEAVVDQQLEKIFGKIQIDNRYVQNRIDKKIATLDERIEARINLSFNDDTFEKHIANVIVKKLAETNSSRMLELIAKGLEAEAKQK